MSDSDIEIILSLFKGDIAVTSTVRDEYYKKLIFSSFRELNRKFPVNLSEIEDQMLLSDYAVWKYRKRNEDVPLSNNLQMRIRNRIVERRASK